MAKTQTATTTQTKTQTRPPVVTIMGHVDHGKTTLLDYIRHSHVADKEHGGITQHIGAYQVEVNQKMMTFIDTPGHEAFTQMRARGSRVTDIVVLVVAADDGIMPQTKESIAHIKAAAVPFVVAANKMDTPGANLERVKKQLAEESVLVEGYGGDVPIVGISAKTGEGVKDLLEIVQLLADLQELPDDPKGELEAVVIESNMDKFKGPVASVLVKNGTLQLGDPLLINGQNQGKVKALLNDLGKPVKEALPSTPVEVLGFTAVPRVGTVVGKIQTDTHEETEAASEQTVASLFEEKKEIRVVLKADKAGSLEALDYSINKLPHEGLNLKYISKETGDINDSDVLLAATSKAIIIGFNVKATANALNLASEEKVNIRTYNIIYELLDELKEGLEALTKPRVVEEELGQAKILAIFDTSRGKVAGCQINSGTVRRGDNAHVKREELLIGTSRIKTIRTGKEEVPKVNAGEECGLLFDDNIDFAIGDLVVAFKKV